MDEWTRDGVRITDASSLARLRSMLEDVGPLIVEHRYYRRGSEPHRFVCDDMAMLGAYFEKRTSPGDSIWIWSFDDSCREDNVAIHGKVPNSDGETPRGGAY